MAFGKDIAKAGAQAERLMSRKGLDTVPQDTDFKSSAPQALAPASAPVNPFGGTAFSREVSKPTAPPSQATPSRPSSVSRPSSTARPGAFGRPQPPSRPVPGPASQASRPPRPAPAQRPASPVSASTAQANRSPSSGQGGAFGASVVASDSSPRPAPEGLDNLFQGYTRMVAATSRRKDGLPLRLERLIDEVSDFLGYDDNRREEAKKRALIDPKAWDQKLTDYFLKTIRPHRAQTAHTLEEARQKHPGKIVYLSIEKGEHSIKVFDRDSERGQKEALLDGATIEAVFSSRTPFPPPKEVFGAADVSQKVDSEAVEDAFSNDPQALPLKSPRP